MQSNKYFRLFDGSNRVIHQTKAKTQQYLLNEADPTTIFQLLQASAKTFTDPKNLFAKDRVVNDSLTNAWTVATIIRGIMQHNPVCQDIMRIVDLICSLKSEHLEVALRYNRYANPEPDHPFIMPVSLGIALTNFDLQKYFKERAPNKEERDFISLLQGMASQLQWVFYQWNTGRPLTKDVENFIHAVGHIWSETTVVLERSPTQENLVANWTDHQRYYDARERRRQDGGAMPVANYITTKIDGWDEYLRSKILGRSFSTPNEHLPKLAQEVTVVDTVKDKTV